MQRISNKTGIEIDPSDKRAQPEQPQTKEQVYLEVLSLTIPFQRPSALRSRCDSGSSPKPSRHQQVTPISLRKPNCPFEQFDLPFALFQRREAETLKLEHVELFQQWKIIPTRID